MHPCEHNLTNGGSEELFTNSSASGKIKRHFLGNSFWTLEGGVRGENTYFIYIYYCLFRSYTLVFSGFTFCPHGTSWELWNLSRRPANSWKYHFQEEQGNINTFIYFSLNAAKKFWGTLFRDTHRKLNRNLDLLG